MFEKKVQLTEKDRQILAEKKKNCAVIGKRVFILFLIMIASVFLNIASLIATRSSDAKALLNGISIASLVLCVPYVIVLISLGKFNKDFRLSGFAYILYMIASTFQSMMHLGLYGMFTALVIFLQVAQIVYLCSAMESVLNEVDGYLGESWVSLKKAFQFVMASWVVCSLLMLVYVLSGIFALVVFVLAIASVILSIWQLVLLLRTARSMTDYSRVSVTN